MAVSELRRPRWVRRRARLQPAGDASVAERAIDCDLGVLALPPDDTVVGPWLAEYGTWEEAEAAILRRWLQPGMNVIDVGAHVGYFSILAAQCVGARGSVVAIEPDRENYTLLVRNVRARGFRNVATVNAAAWSHATRLELARSPEHNSGDHRVRPPLAAGPAVDGLRLDDLIDARTNVDVIKIDTQGTDHLVIQGARALISRCRPRLLVEYWPPGIVDVDAAELPDQYRSLGYRITAIEAPTLASDADGEAFVAAAHASEHGFLTLLLEP